MRCGTHRCLIGGCMALIVGVHGIAQQQLGRNLLVDPWSRALADGIERASRPPVPPPPLDIAYYGDVFLPPAGSGKAAGNAERVLAELTDDECADLEDAARDVLTPDEIATAEDEQTKAYTRTPIPLQAFLRALDRRFGASAGVLYLGELRQVRRYLTDPALKAEVDARIDAAVLPECRILVGHSLGSVVAREYVRRHPEHRLDLMVTLGSPLGLRMIRSRLPGPDLPMDGTPAQLADWVNVRDPRDPVACAGDLRTWWQWIDERQVNNQSDAHSVTRYLAKREVGDAILRRAPELAAR